MSDFSLTLVLHFKTSKYFNGMAKVQIKSEKITPFGGIFHVRELYSRYVGPVIDKVLGLRCTSDTILRGISELGPCNAYWGKGMLHTTIHKRQRNGKIIAKWRG